MNIATVSSNDTEISHLNLYSNEDSEGDYKEGVGSFYYNPFKAHC